MACHTPELMWFELVKTFAATELEKGIPPSIPAVVYVALTVITFTEIDELRSTVTGLVYLTKSWSDPRLTVNECTVGGMPPQGMPISFAERSQVWQPSIGVVSALSSSEPAAPDTFDQSTLTYSDEEKVFYVTNTQALLLTIPCLSNFKKFPFDRTDCEFVLSTPRSHPDLSDIRWWPGIAPSTISEQFNTLSSHYVTAIDAVHEEIDAVREEVNGILGRNFTADIIRVRFKRFAMFYVLQGYVPNVFTCMVSWLSFLIKPDAVPARVSLSVSSLIAIMLQYANLVKTIPKVGYFKSIDLWNLVCVIFIFITSLEFTIVCLLKRLETKRRPATYAKIDRYTAVSLLSAFVLFGIVYFAVLTR